MDHIVDDLDIKIIKKLINNPRMSFTKIAKECGVSSVTIKNRFNNLKKTGVILGSTGIVNIEKIGYMCHLSFYVKVKFDKIKEFMEYTYELPGVMTAQCKLNKDYNVHVLLPIKDMAEIEKMEVLIKSHPAVIDVKTNIWTEIISLPENFSMECQ